MFRNLCVYVIGLNLAALNRCGRFAADAFLVRQAQNPVQANNKLSLLRNCLACPVTGSVKAIDLASSCRGRR